VTQHRAPGHRSHSADEALARIDRGIEQAESRAAQAREFADGYAALEGTGASDGGDVRVTVGPEGLLSRLTITDAAASSSGASVRAAILAANAAAVADLRHRAESLTAQAWGAGSATAAAVADELPVAAPRHPDADATTDSGRSAW
jgi:DNA-binding protein YbaB